MLRAVSCDLTVDTLETGDAHSLNGLLPKTEQWLDAAERGHLGAEEPIFLFLHPAQLKHTKSRFWDVVRSFRICRL